MDLLDETTRRVLGVADVLASARPCSDYGCELAGRPRTFRPMDHSDWAVEQSLLREVEAWWCDDVAIIVREAFAHLPPIQRSLLVLESGDTLDDTGLFELKRFLYWAHAVVPHAAGDLSFVLGSWGEQLAALMHQLHPERQPSPRFRLSAALDEQLAGGRENVKKAREAEHAFRADVERQLVEAHGGHFDINGLFVAPAGEVADPRLQHRGAGRFGIVDLELTALALASNDALEHCSAIEQAVRVKLSNNLRSRLALLRELRESLALLDIYCARVDLRRAWGGCWPSWAEETSFESARHPRLIARLGDDAQPIDVTIARHPTIVTGPNMGGKSVLLELVGVIQWLAQHGFPVPAASCTFRPVESIVYVGSEESRDDEGGLSSFGREVRRVVDAGRANAPVLWLLDEFGRGTHPEEGAQIAADFIRQRSAHGDVVVAATHFPALAKMKDAEHLQIAGISHPEALSALGPDPSLAEVERALRLAMDYRPIVRSADDQDVPRDARLVARALGLDFGD